MGDRDRTLSIIGKRTEQLGDLPIFSASVNHICKISTDPDSTALALSTEMGKDANLSTKILRLVNSSYYDRGKGKISVLSRAVVVLGFSTIKNICLTLKLIDSFQHEHPSIDMNKILVNAYLAAGFVREVAMRCGVKDVEDTYTCALLHNLGEIATAYFLPEKYLAMQKMMDSGTSHRLTVEQEVLGMSIKEIGQYLAESWEFPPSIVRTMDDYNPETETVGLSSARLNRALSSLGNRVVESLQGQSSSKRMLNELLADIAEVAGLDHSIVQHGLVDSFTMSCELASDYGLKRSLLMPSNRESGDEFRDRLAGKLSYYASNYRSTSAAREYSKELVDTVEHEVLTAEGAVEGKEAGNLSPEPATASGVGGEAPAPSAVTPTREVLGDNEPSNLQVQLEIVQEITALLASKATLTDVFIKALEGIHRGVGFERAALILLNRDRSAYSARAAAGSETGALREFFQLPIDPDQDLFSKVLMEGNELLISDSSAAPWAVLLPHGFQEHVGAPSFMIGALRHGSRPIGLYYADNANSRGAIPEEQRRGFMQFLSQARLAVQVSNNPAN